MCKNFVSSIESNEYILKCTFNLRYRNHEESMQQYLKRNNNFWRQMTQKSIKDVDNSNPHKHSKDKSIVEIMIAKDDHLKKQMSQSSQPHLFQSSSHSHEIMH